MKRKKQVVLIGDSGEFPDKNEAAYKIGKFVAENGWVLLSGGRTGVMNAASKGAFEANGISVAITPFDNFEGATEYASIVIPSGIGYARNYTNVLAGDVIVSIGGGGGTLCELTYAWQFEKPIIACSFAEGWSKEMAGKNVDYKRNDPIYEAKTLEDVFSKLKEVLQ